MFEKIKTAVNNIVDRYKLKNLREIYIFIILLLVFTLLGLIWKYFFDYKIFGVHVLDPGYAFLTRYIVLSSYWILNHVFLIPLSYSIETSRLYFSNISYLYIYHGCTGLKEMAMFLFIILYFPGRLTAKLWFIPASLLIIYCMAILRIVFLGLAYRYRPAWFSFMHEYLFNIIFFFLIFMLWIAWINWINKKSQVISDSDLKSEEK